MTDAQTTGGANLVQIANEVMTVDELLLKLFPEISMIAGLATGGTATPILAGVGAVLQAVDNGAKFVAAGNPGAAAASVLETIVNHLTPGQPNSPILSTPLPEAS